MESVISLSALKLRENFECYLLPLPLVFQEYIRENYSYPFRESFLKQR